MTIYLYVKQHRITGLKYFGRTTKDPNTYMGSGTYWLSHIKKYGIEYVDTIELYEFDCQEKCTSFAKSFSVSNNIVESTEWANLILEDGLARYTGNTSEKHSATMREKWLDSEYRTKQHSARKEKWRDNSYRNKLVSSRKNNWVNEDYRAKTISNNIASRTTEYKEKQAAKMKKIWSDPEFREAQLSKRRKGLIWINNGTIEKKIEPDSQLPSDFKFGRLYRKRK
jgi:hypothetical protein